MLFKIVNDKEHANVIRRNTHNKTWELNLYCWKIDFYDIPEYCFYFHCYKPFHASN